MNLQMVVILFLTVLNVGLTVNYTAKLNRLRQIAEGPASPTGDAAPSRQPTPVGR